MVLFQSFFLLFRSFKKVPKASIEGTQIPINMAAFASPLKYSTSEKISERNAAINNNLSVKVNFFNMVLIDFKKFTLY